MRSLTVLGLLLAGLFGERPAADSSAPDKRPVVSVSLELVQVDAVVTDGKGRHVEDLGCEDFEIYEDRRKQTITNCSFVRTPDSQVPTSGQGPPRPAGGTRPIRREDVRRTIAVVVDDLGLDVQSVKEVRTALEAFIERQTAPGDLVSIVRTSGGAGALQQFTNDRRLLRAAIERIRFDTRALDALEPQGAVPVLGSPTAGSGNLSLPRPRGRGASDIANLHADMLAYGTLGTLRFVLLGLRDLPGRKSVVMFSRGYAMRNLDKSLTAFGRSVSSLVDLANRASAVIYTVDTAGVRLTGQLSAADNMNPAGGGGFTGAVLGQLEGQSFLINPRYGLDALSDPTGGFLLRGQNDLSRQLARVLEDQKGYYLIGYVPAASAFSPGGKPAFHRIQVKVRRRGLRVRSREGYFGMTDDDPRLARPREQVSSLAASLMSPFTAGEVGLRLSSVFYQDDAGRALLHSFLQVRAEDMTLTADPDGTFRAHAEVLACTFDADGQLVDQLSRAGELRLTPEARDTAARYGINYTIDVPVKKAGGYQLRVALRDTASGRVGSAYQFVEVPDLASERLALSGILMTNAASEGSDSAGAFATAARPAFAPGQPIAYGLTIYNARVDPLVGQAALQTQVRVLLDGKEVITGEPRAVATEGQPSRKALFAGGVLVLPRQMSSGEYQLLVTVVDAQAPPDRRMAVQTALFEVEAP